MVGVYKNKSCDDLFVSVPVKSLCNNANRDGDIDTALQNVLSG